MITMKQALEANEFHQELLSRPCSDRLGPIRWRRNGRTQIWRRQPQRFRIPVKYGMYAYDQITETTKLIHAADDCPVLMHAESGVYDDSANGIVTMPAHMPVTDRAYPGVCTYHMHEGGEICGVALR